MASGTLVGVEERGLTAAERAHYGITLSEEQALRAVKSSEPLRDRIKRYVGRTAPESQSFVATESKALTAAEERHVSELASRNRLDVALVRESYVASTRELGGARFVEPPAAAFTESPGVTFDDRRLGNRALDTLQASEGITLTAQEREHVIGLATRSRLPVEEVGRNFARSKASRR